MKILDPIPTSEVPAQDWRKGRAKNPIYDQILLKVQKMSSAKTLPIECDDLTKAKTLYAAIMLRIKASDGSLKIKVFRMGNVVYLQKEK